MPGQGLRVVVTFGVQKGSRTQAWSYDCGVVSSVGGASNGPSSGSTSATVAGLSFGSAGYSGRVRGMCALIHSSRRTGLQNEKAAFTSLAFLNGENII